MCVCVFTWKNLSCMVVMATSTTQLMSEVCRDLKKGNKSIVMESRCSARWQSKPPKVGRVIRPHGRGSRNDSPKEEHGIGVEGPIRLHETGRYVLTFRWQLTSQGKLSHAAGPAPNRRGLKLQKMLVAQPAYLPSVI